MRQRLLLLRRRRASAPSIATSDGGTTWTQQGNPISGPTSAINATSIALNGAACTSARCLVGLGAQGDILTTPLLTVTVHATGVVRHDAEPLARRRTAR